MEGRRRSTITALGVSFLVFIFLIVLAGTLALRFLEFSGTDAGAKIIATAITVGGGLVASIVTLIGLVLRQTIQQKAEQRLKMEAAIKAMSLLGTASGGDTNLLQRTGALFSLSRLGSIELALDLLPLMRVEGQIGPRATCSILDLGLQSKDVTIQRSAAEFLRDHSALLMTKEGLCWPDYISYRWPQDLDYRTRDYALTGLTKGIISHKRNKWREDNLYALITNLVAAFREEKDPRLSTEITFTLQALLKIFRHGAKLYLPDGDLTIDTLQQQVSKKAEKFTVPSYVKDTIDEIDKWINEEIPVDQANTDV